VGLGPNILLAKQLGVNPHDELQNFLRQYALTRRFDTWGGVTKDGRYITDLSEINQFKASQAS
jgi:hypothetical protein